LDAHNAGMVPPPMRMPRIVKDNIPTIQLITTLTYSLQVMGIVFSAPGFPSCGAVLFWHPKKEEITRFVEARSLIVLTSAAFGLLTVSVLTTVLVVTLKALLGQVGNTFALNVHSGTLFLALTWTASVLVSLASVLWAPLLFFRRRERRLISKRMNLKEQQLLDEK